MTVSAPTSIGFSTWNRHNASMRYPYSPLLVRVSHRAPNKLRPLVSVYTVGGSE